MPVAVACEQRTYAHRGVAKAKELDKGRSEIKLPSKHGRGPAIKDDVPGVGKDVAPSGRKAHHRQHPCWRKEGLLPRKQLRQGA